MNPINQIYDCSQSPIAPFTANNLRVPGPNLATLGQCSGSWTSPVIPLADSQMISGQLSFSGSYSGSIELQFSNDPGLTELAQTVGGGPLGNIFNWTTPVGYFLQFNGVGSVILDYPQCGFKYAQFKCTRASGTSAMTLGTCGKGGGVSY
jgi:hypothetical protein